MHRIFKAAKKCGYLSKVIEPLDSREAKNIDKAKIFDDIAVNAYTYNLVCFVFKTPIPTRASQGNMIIIPNKARKNEISMK